MMMLTFFGFDQKYPFCNLVPSASFHYTRKAKKKANLVEKCLFVLSEI